MSSGGSAAADAGFDGDTVSATPLTSSSASSSLSPPLPPPPADPEQATALAAAQAQAELTAMEAKLNLVVGAPKLLRTRLIPQTQSDAVLERSRLPPVEDPSHVDFTGVDLKRCWARFLPTANRVFYDKVVRVATIENAASGPSEAYGADGTARIVQRGAQWVLQYVDLTLINSRGTEVRTMLTTKRQTKKSTDVEDLIKTQKGRVVEFESGGADGAHRGAAAGGMGVVVEQALHYAEGKLPETLERNGGANGIHPVEWVGIVLAKPSLAKPRTVDALLYGVGNFATYTRPPKLRKQLYAAANAVRDHFFELERRAHAGRPSLRPETHHSVAKEVFQALGKRSADRLLWLEFVVALRKMGFHWSEHRLRPLFRLADAEDEGWIGFQDFKHVLLVASQLPPPGCASLWEYFAEFSRQNRGWINDLEFWQILHCSTTLGAKGLVGAPSIEEVEACFMKFRRYSAATPEYELDYARFKELWVATVCQYDRCRAELVRRGVGRDLLKAKGVTSRGPPEFLLEVLERIDNWDVLCFERAKVQAFMTRRQHRMAAAEELYDRTRRRGSDNVKAREKKALDNKDYQKRELVKERERQRSKTFEDRLKDQVCAGEEGWCCWWYWWCECCCSWLGMVSSRRPSACRSQLMLTSCPTPPLPHRRHHPFPSPFLHPYHTHTHIHMRMCNHTLQRTHTHFCSRSLWSPPTARCGSGRC